MGERLLPPGSESLSEGEVLATLIGKAPSFADVVSRLPAIARAEGCVLISGETGTGKE
jgi:transcriptional regulator with GAF, ATPase, and Fis domain